MSITREQAIKKLQNIGTKIAKEMGYTQMIIGEDRTQGILGEQLTDFLERKYGECAKTIKWVKEDSDLEYTYGDNIGFEFRFSSPKLCIDHRNVDGSFASIELSDWNDGAYAEYQKELAALGENASYKDKKALEEKYEPKYKCGDFKLKEIQVFQGDNNEGLKFLQMLLDAWNEEANKHIKDGQVSLKIGENYSFGGYDWVAAEQCDEYVVLQSCGVTSGSWPGYAMSEFGNDNYYSNSIDGQDISDYDEKTKELYSIIKEAEYTSASYGKGLFLISTNKASSYYASDYYIAALKNAAKNRSSFGASYGYARLGTVGGSYSAWYVNSSGSVSSYGYDQNYSFVVAPAFNLDLSKIRLEGNRIIIKDEESNTDPLTELIEKAKELESVLPSEEEIEIEIYDGTITISKYNPDRGSAIELLPFCSEEEINLDELRKACDKNGWSYVL